MVLDLTAEQHGAIRQLLTRLHREDAVFYGTHESTSGLMTCIVFSRAAGHLHFIDGADGGYAIAAKELKAQMAGAVAEVGSA